MRSRFAYVLTVAGVVALLVFLLRWHRSGPTRGPGPDRRIEAVTSSSTERPTGHALDQPGNAARRRPPGESQEPTWGREGAFQFHSLDPGGVALEGIALYWRKASDSFVLLGLTDSQGSLQHAPIQDCVEPVLLAARGPGRATRTLVLERPEEPRVVFIEIDPASCIVGTVRRTDGIPVEAGVTIVAWPAALRPPRENGGWTMGEVASHPLIEAATTDPSGRFELSGLLLGETYILVAGGNGYMTWGLPLECIADGGEKVIEAHRLYSAIVCFKGQDGRDAKVPQAIVIGQASSWTMTVPGCHPVGGYPLQAELAGLDEVFRLLPTSCAGFVYTGPSPAAPSLGPLRLEERLAGHLPLMLEIQLAPVSDGPARYTATLHASAPGWGELEVLIDRSTTGMNGPPRPRPGLIGRILLRAMDGTVLQIPMSDLGKEAQVLSQIPIGRYEVGFHSQGGTFRYPRQGAPSEVIEIGAERARFVIDASGLGTIRIVAEDGGSLAAAGSLRVMVGHGEEDLVSPGLTRLRGTEIRVGGPPHLIQHVEPGTYTLRLHDPVCPGAASVVVRAAETATARFAIPSPRR